MFFSATLRPGDAMTTSVVANGGGSFTLTLTDSTRGWAAVTGVTGAAPGGAGGTGGGHRHRDHRHGLGG